MSSFVSSPPTSFSLLLLLWEIESWAGSLATKLNTSYSSVYTAQFVLMFLFIQRILCLVEMVTFGMHSSHYFMNFCLPNVVQSVVSISLLAFSKSAWTYFQMARFLTFIGGGLLDHFRVRVHVNPLWSELLGWNFFVLKETINYILELYSVITQEKQNTFWQ